MLDGGLDPRVSPAPADVAAHRSIDVAVGRLRIAGEKCRSRHDLARLAVAALDDLKVEPRLLYLRTSGRLPNSSMVVILRPATSTIAVWHERIGSPSQWTVQQPRRAAPPPNFVPVSPATSRKTQRSGVSSATSKSLILPLISIAGMTNPSCQNERRPLSCSASNSSRPGTRKVG